ncbi:Fuc2NAc and GlcNAc transferase [Burkholderiales bacterium]|nr:Fuc2NAc and GlcNAc transferase [Burkholderiales bacterium]
MIALALALGLSTLVLAILARRPGLAPGDRPNERSLHAQPVPRAGGWAIAAGWAAAALVAGLPPGFDGAASAALVGALAVLFAVSLADDWRGVAPAWRLVVQVGCAALVATALAGASATGAAGIAGTTFVLVAAANFFNFMDGSDGLAGSMAVTGFASLGAGAAIAGAPAVALLAPAAAALPFLVRNLPPARIFLGDAGSVPLGFLAAGSAVAGNAAGLWPVWFPALAFLPFLTDATATLATRAIRGERLWEAHRGHYYQRLVRLGAGHRGTLAVYGVLMLGCGATAVACLAFRPDAGPAALAAWIAVIVAVFAGIDYHWRQRA